MLKIGDRVKVMFPSNEQSITETMRTFQGKVTVIKKEHHFKNRTTAYKAFTLAGCKSDFGIDYLFLEDWLIPME